MPKEITHWMLAERALEALPEGSGLRTLIARHKSSYLGGAVLPDTLAHIFRGPFHPKARELGQRFHDPHDNSYQPLIGVERRYPEGIPPAILACLLGVICHIEADVALHPYVYAATGSGGIGEHYRIETAIDVHFLKKGAAPAQRRLDRLASPATRQVLATAARHLFDPHGELPAQAIEHSLELHCRFQAMYDRTLWKVAVRLLAKVVGSPYREQRQLFYPLRGRLNFRPAETLRGRFSSMGIEAAGGAGWLHPETGEVRRCGVDDLAREAVARTVEVFRRIEEAGTLAEALEGAPGANLLTGLHGVTKKS